MPERPPDPQLDESTNRWMMWGAALMALFVVLFIGYRITEPSRRAEAKEQLHQELVDHGEQLFAENCVACHGADGSGGIGPALNSKQFLGEASDSQILGLISTGVPGTQMSAYLQDNGGSMTLEDIVSLVTYIREWEPDAPDVPNWRDITQAP